MGDESFGLWFPILLTVALLALGFVAGSIIESRHFRDIRQREQKLRKLVATNFRTLPSSWQAQEGQLVTGSVVVFLDDFKRFLAGLRGLIGGRVRSYETLLDRGRREATLRMKDMALESGCNAIINLRMETAKLASSRRDGKGVAGVEVLVFGTGIRLTRPTR